MFQIQSIVSIIWVTKNSATDQSQNDLIVWSVLIISFPFQLQFLCLLKDAIPMIFTCRSSM